MAKPKSTSWNGEDEPTSEDRENIKNYERYKKSRTNPEPDLIDKIGSRVNSWVADARKNAMKPLGKGKTYKPMPGSPNMARVEAVAKAKAKAKKKPKYEIQGSPTN